MLCIGLDPQSFKFPMKKYLLLTLLCVISIKLYPQDKLVLDSLLVSLQYAKEDSCKLSSLCGLFNYYVDRNLLKSLEYSQQALEVARRMENSTRIAYVQFRRGEQLLLSGDYDEALKHLFQSLKIYDEAHDTISLYKVYNNIGAIYNRIHDYDKSLEYYFKAVDSYNKKDSRGNHPYTIYNNIGNIYSIRNEIDTALEYYQKSLDLAKTFEDFRVMGAVYNNLGKLYTEMGNYDEAYAHLQSSLKCNQKIDDKNGLAKSYYFLANYYIQVREYNKALGAIRNSLDMGKEVGALLTSQMAYQLLYEAYEKKGDMAKALEAYKLYKTVSDSLINEKTIQEITKVKMQFDFDKKEKLIKAEQEKRKFKYALIISILSLCVIITGLLYNLMRNRTKRIHIEKKQLHLENKNLENDLEIKNKELTTHVMYLIQKNMLISNITDKMLSLKKKVKPENRESMQKIILELYAAVEREAWDEFECRFQQVHTHFYAVLQERFPQLTPGEKKLAAFLRLNMSTKEIAAILGISTNSVDVARYRLRKKIGLVNTEVNLVNYLSELA